ncbi:endoribonuclease YbeY [Spirochaetia bacterium]|nr:endoribonuclease YbeY [Spirochaetia bacterium]
MNRIEVNAEEVPLPEWEGALKNYTLMALDKIHRDGWDLSILLCNDSYIQSLNKKFRQKDEATDVLSFPLGETIKEDSGDRYLPGDIVISLDTLAENSRYFNISQDEELRRLLIHGILHLDGMDHETNNETEPMLRLQEKILADLAGERIFALPQGGWPPKGYL